MRANQRYNSASLVKAMLLVAYLNKLAGEQRRPTGRESFWLDAMIRVSDNESASQLFRRLGPGPVRVVAQRAGMRSFRLGTDWAEAAVTAGDQARFFAVIDRLVAPSRRTFARYILSVVEPQQRWGIPAAARPRWQPFFKGGWRPDRSGDLVHQAALLESGRRRIAIAVLTNGNSSEDYGQATVRGVAAHVLLPPPRTPRATTRSDMRRLLPLQSLSGHRPPEPHPVRRLSS
jgi:Beta-lactamase enzyme family